MHVDNAKSKWAKIRYELLTVEELTKQEEMSSLKNRESGTVYFTNIGSRSRRTDCDEIWQFSSSDRRNQTMVGNGTAIGKHTALERCIICLSTLP
jgi:hypothetical protein